MRLFPETIDPGETLGSLIISASGWMVTTGSKE